MPVKLDTLHDWKIALHGVKPSDSSGIDTVLGGIQVVIHQPDPTPPSVDVAYIESQRAEVSKTMDAVKLLPVATTVPDLRDRAALLRASEIRIELWNLVLGSGWDAAAERVLEYWKQSFRVNMADQVHTARADALSAQRWWRQVVRRAVREGLDLELLALAMY